MTFFDKLRQKLRRKMFKLRQKTFDELRRGVLKRMVRRAARVLFVDWFDVIPPYDYTKSVSESHVHRYLGLERSEVKSWVIVGGQLGPEVKTILRNYPNCTVTIFECSERYLTRLRKRFQNNSRVEIIGKAVSDSNGRVEFFETSLGSSGSLLKVGELARTSYGMEQAESFLVDTVRLDDHFRNKQLDVLQIDVQGAEQKVLNGAKQVLRNTKAVLTEVSVLPDLYVGATTMDEIDEILKAHKFNLISLGTNLNLVGDALYLRSNDYSGRVKII